MKHFIIVFGILALSTLGCDSDSDGDGGGGGNGGGLPAQGTVVPPWDMYCLATFTTDYTVVDVFEDPLFTARSGDVFLLRDHGMRFGEVRTEMYYLAPNGALDFTVAPAEDGSLVFTSNCDLENTRRRHGVFRDFTVYVDEGLTEPACELTAGTVFDGALGVRVLGNEGDSLTDIEGHYSIDAPGLAEYCNGHSVTYVKVGSERILDGYHTFVPIRSFLSESESAP